MFENILYILQMTTDRPMNLLRYLLIASLSVLLLASCGKKAVKVVSVESKLAVEASSIVAKINESYQKKDYSGVENMMTREGYRSFMSGLKSFDRAEIELSPVLLEIDGNVLHYNFSWKGTWYISGKTTEERGMAVFVFRGTPLKLDNIMRSNPYSHP